MDGDIVYKLDTRHPDSAEMLDVWERCEDVRAGQQEVHEGGEKYLPKLSGQTDADYEAYKRRAVFYGAMSRTVDAFIGMILRVPPLVDNPSPLLDDIDTQNTTLTEFSEEMLEEIMVIGFGGIMVEHANIPGEMITLADAQMLGARPYLALFDAESIINWKLERGILTQVVLCEEEMIDESEFVRKEREFYRVLDLDESGHYRQRKFVKSETNVEQFIQVGDDIYPVMNGAPLTEIPFYFFGECDDLPPLIDLVDLNISHYMTTADLENGCHFTGIPQPWLAGVQLNDGEKLSVGGINAWVFSDPQASASYLEFSGQGLGALERRLELKEKQMAALGAKMLSDSVRAETATSSNLRTVGEFSVVAKIADQAAKILNRACNFMLAWAGESETKIAFNKDYLPAKMQPQELQALVQAWQAGAISAQTLFSNLQQGEIVAQEVNFEDEQAAIGETMPPAPAMIAPNAG